MATESGFDYHQEQKFFFSLVSRPPVDNSASNPVGTRGPSPVITGQENESGNCLCVVIWVKHSSKYFRVILQFHVKDFRVCLIAGVENANSSVVLDFPSV